VTAHPGGSDASTRSLPARGRRPAADGYLLAVDAGTGSCRAVLFDRAGRQVALAQREWSHRATRGIAGSQNFDTALNWALICGCIRQALGSVADPGAVLAVGCSSMGGGLVLYDRAGRELWACANGDARAGRQAAELLASGTAARLYQLGGGWISLSAPPRLAWVRQHRPALWESCARLSMIADWIVYRLTGTLVTEPSIGSTSGMFDLGARAWSPGIVDLCGLRPALFPEVVDAGTVAGTVTLEAAAQTGLAAGTPVVPGGVDTALGLVGARCCGHGQLTVTGGSFWKQTAVATAAVVEPAGRLRTVCHVLPGQWLAEGIGFYAGLALRWLRDSAASSSRPGDAPDEPGDPGDLGDLDDPGEPGGYAALERLAAAVPPGSQGVIAELGTVDAWTWARWRPPFRPPPPGQAPEASLGAQARAVEEAAAYSARRSAGILAGLLGLRFSDVVFTGGAARGRLWPQILADVLGLAVRVPDVTESAARGAAGMAGLAVGVRPDSASPVGAAPPAARVADPVPARQRAYEVLYGQWLGRGLGLPVGAGLEGPAERAHLVRPGEHQPGRDRDPGGEPGQRDPQ
jgi:autoinducer 2 (AI-2) kinase